MYLNGVSCMVDAPVHRSFVCPCIFVSIVSLSEQVLTQTDDTFMSAFYVFFYNPSSLLTPVYAFNVLQLLV